MPRNPSRFAKMQRERERQKRREERAQRRQDRRTESKAPRDAGEEDPDIAGIVPGPQAQPWMDDDVDQPAGGGDDDSEAQGPQG